METIVSTSVQRGIHVVFAGLSTKPYTKYFVQELVEKDFNLVLTQNLSNNLK